MQYKKYGPPPPKMPPFPKMYPNLDLVISVKPWRD